MNTVLRVRLRAQGQGIDGIHVWAVGKVERGDMKDTRRGVVCSMAKQAEKRKRREWEF